MKKNIITRRKLIKDTTTAAMGASLLLGSSSKLFGSLNSGNKSKVVLIRNENIPDYGTDPDSNIVKNMIDEALIELTSSNSATEAWNSIIKPKDIVGIKSNEWSYLPTPKEVEQAIKERVIEVGVPAEKISIADRKVLTDPIFRQATALINTRPMRTHNWSGVGSLLKNYITFAKNKPGYHPDSCADLATLYELPEVKGKSRLHILVMFTPLFHGVGPHHFNKEYVWSYKGLIVGFDPVAVDSVGLQIIKAKRLAFFGEDKPLNPPAKHIALAETRHNLGIANPEKINLVKIGLNKDILI